MQPERARSDMQDQHDDRLMELGRQIDAEPNFSFLRDLVAEHPDAESYLVGGIVRDMCLARPAKDYDFVIRGVPAEQLKQFLDDRGTVNLVGRTFGVNRTRTRSESRASMLK